MHDFQQRLGYSFQQEALLREALTHPSSVRKPQKGHTHNQRLEFLGDSVLQLAVTEKLYQLFPLADEGDMTKLRSRVVSREHLARIARSINLGAVLLLGSGEERNSGRDRESNLADAMEAVIGAVHQDGGWAASQPLVLHLLNASFLELQSQDSPEFSNAKGTLQELMQKDGGSTPVYQCVEEFGDPHSRNYTVALLWQDQELSRGTGKSKRAAETEAAKIALAKWLTARRINLEPTDL